MPSQRTSTVAIAALLFTLFTCTKTTETSKSATEDVRATAVAASPGFAKVLTNPQQVAFLTDIPGGAPAASLTDAANFAWQQFIVATWAAQPNGQGGYNRDTADSTAIYGKNADVPTGPPLVWETFRHKVEIFPGFGSGAPHGSEKGAPDFGYNDPPEYDYSPGVVTGVCNGGTQAPTTPWVNADENSQIFLTYMFAGTAAPTVQEILFMAKANHVHYQYSVNPASIGQTQLNDALWNHGGGAAGTNYNAAVANFATYAAAVNKIQPPPTQPVSVTPLVQPFISFPSGSATEVGTMEVKSAWRPLSTTEANSGRFHVTTARTYTSNGKNTFCYSDEAYGLLALHIIQKTPSAPYFIYATFSQADNILTASGAHVEDENGNIIVQNPGPDLDTGLTGAGQNPELATLATPTTLESYNTATGQPNPSNPPAAQCAPGQRLYLQDIGNYQPSGTACVNQRAHPIPQEVIAVNTAAHQAISQYTQQNNPGGKNPWLYYKLVNVQTSPIDKPPGVLYSGPAPATYYQANDVVETNYNLQNFSGRLVADPPIYGTIMSDYADNPSNPPSFNSTLPFKNTFFLKTANGSSVQPYNMGGCMGCHGNAQQAGDDFSYIMNVGLNDAPEARTTAAQIAAMVSNPTSSAALAIQKSKKFRLPH